jgi:exosortase/archaeosortase family protein
MYNILKIKNLNNIQKKYNELIRFGISFLLAIFISIVFNDISSIKNFIAESNFTFWILNLTGNLTLFFLDLFNYNYTVDGVLIKLQNTNGVLIVFGCLAYRHILLFIVFILTYIGKIYHKLWYILLGMLVLIFMNSFRIFLIALSQIDFPEYTYQIHFYLTRLMMYGTLFLLWFIWIKRLLNKY